MIHASEQTDTMTPEHEAALVDRAQGGDHRALDQLLEAHYQRMYYLALKVTRNPTKAEDVTHDACTQVLRRIGQFRSEARFGSWVSRIVVNCALLRHRKEKRMVPTPEIYSPAAVANEPAPERLASDRELLDLTDRFLDRLRDGDRQLFVRRFVDGVSLKGLSKETGLSLPALKSRFHRARLQLRAEQRRMRWGQVGA
ncbi:MAG: sigma-70 family RNA polymerase sigma factor [Myxococcales bacterium]|nr:sigma-70 family RNA polymerase sigma factor [Myxococcales bacterium]